MKLLMQIIFIITHPSFWIQNYETSKQLTDRLNKLLDNGEKFILIDEYKAKFGDHILWIENHPYASFYLHRKSYLGMASKHTRYRLKKRLMESI